jgi:hypothetical protein
MAGHPTLTAGDAATRPCIGAQLGYVGGLFKRGPTGKLTRVPELVR